jgi:hypothetical protein
MLKPPTQVPMLSTVGDSVFETKNVHKHCSLLETLAGWKYLIIQKFQSLVVDLESRVSILWLLSELCFNGLALLRQCWYLLQELQDWHHFRSMRHKVTIECDQAAYSVWFCQDKSGSVHENLYQQDWYFFQDVDNFSCLFTLRIRWRHVSVRSP